MEKYTIIIIIYYLVQFIFATVHIITSHLNIPGPREVTKALPIFMMLGLVLYLWPRKYDSAKQFSWKSKFSLLYSLGIILGGIGDIFLLSDALVPNGIGSALFLAGHVFYILAYLPNRKEIDWIKFALGESVVLTTGIALSFVFFPFIEEYPSISKQPLPPLAVLALNVYILIEGTAILTYLNFPKTPERCRYCQIVGMCGGFFFLISDVVLIANFVLPKPSVLKQPIIMVTYYAAQFCIGYSTRQTYCPHREGNDFKDPLLGLELQV